MAVQEFAGFLKYKDADGNVNLLMPITTVDYVDGMDEIHEMIGNTVKIIPQTLTDEQKAQARENIGITPDMFEGVVGGGSGSTSVSWNDIIDKPFKVVDDKYLDNQHLSILDHTPPVVNEILPLTRFENFQLDDRTGCYVLSINRKDIYNLVAGDKYIVNWDGNEYTCVAQDSSALIEGSVAMGDFSAYGLPGNGEPFIIILLCGVGVTYAALTDTEPGGFHDIGISQKISEATYKIKPEYLPDDDPLTVILEEQTFTGFEQLEESYYVCDITDILPITIGETYIVMWDGVQYEVVAINAEDILGESHVLLGNGTPLGLTGNGEPFSIDVYPEGASILVIDDDSPSHKIGIYQSIEELIIPSFTTDDEGKVLSVKDGVLSWETVEVNDNGETSATSLLPPVTTEDNGKFLRVVDGMWAAAIVSVAEEASF